MTPLRRALAFLLVLAFIGMASLGAMGNVAATQNAPSVGVGNSWTYAVTVFRGGSNHTIGLDVREQTSLTIAGTAYPVWHIKETAVQPTSSATVTTWSDFWLTVDGLRVAKLVSAGVPFLGNVTSTYNPPSPQAVFPLTPGGSWSIPSQVNVSSNLGSTVLPTTASGIVNREVSVTVPAGTFTAAEIRSPSSGNPYSVSYYSEQEGWFVRVDSYNGAGALTSIQNLTSTNYSVGLFGIPNIVWIIGLVIAFIVVVAAVMYMRRRPRVPRPMYPQQPYQPPPPQPPQQGPPST